MENPASMQSVRCYGETKFFRQCPRYIIAPVSDDPCFCWEHLSQTQIRVNELNEQKQEEDTIDWRPIGAYTSNNIKVTKVVPGRMSELAEDEENVHTPEVQVGVNGCIRALQAWATREKIKTERDLASLVQWSLIDPDIVELQALDHLRHCYRWNDDTKMFGITYPQLASWVWARVNRPTENRGLLIERFYEEVSDSAGLCLNGNMVRLMNVFTAIDPELSMQSDVITRDMLPSAVTYIITNCGQADAMKQVRNLLQEAQIPESEWEDWLSQVRDMTE